MEKYEIKELAMQHATSLLSEKWKSETIQRWYDYPENLIHLSFEYAIIEAWNLAVIKCNEDANYGDSFDPDSNKLEQSILQNIIQ